MVVATNRSSAPFARPSSGNEAMFRGRSMQAELVANVILKYV